jgi:hypothetical protein
VPVKKGNGARPGSGRLRPPRERLRVKPLHRVAPPQIAVTSTACPSPCVRPESSAARARCRGQ